MNPLKFLILILSIPLFGACGGGGSTSSTAASTSVSTAPISDFTCLTTPTALACRPPLYTVLFTHIEDSTPTGTLGSAVTRTNYLYWRDRVIQMAQLARRYNMTWVLQPDWKLLEAVRLNEDSATMGSTNGQNVLRYLRDNWGVVIDAHAHQNGAYNYTDIAYLPACDADHDQYAIGLKHGRAGCAAATEKPAR